MAAPTPESDIRTRSPEGEPPEVEQERSLIIGVIGPETGEEAHFGLRTLAGVTMAAETFNAKGGIGGKPIKILHFDNQSDLASTESIVQDLIRRRVIAIIAAPTGWSTFAPTRLANASRTIFMAVGTRRQIAHSGSYIFRFALPVKTAVDDLIRHVVEERGHTGFALVTSSLHDHSLTLSAAFKQSVAQHRGTMVTEADSYDSYSGRSDHVGVIRALAKESEAIQAILFSGGDKEGAQLALALRKAGLRQPLIGGEDLFTEGFLEIGGDAVVGSLLFSAYPLDQEVSIRDPITALAFDAFTAIATAIGQAGTTRSSKVTDALLTTAIEGITGRTRFTDEGETVKRPFLYRVDGNKNREGSVFVRIGKTDG